MFTYENIHSNKDDYIKNIYISNLNFSTNLHNSYEFTYCKCGELMVTIEDNIYKLCEGDCILIPPMKAHSYETLDFSDIYICIFSQFFIEDFYIKYTDKIASNPIFRLFHINEVIYNLHLNNKWLIKSALYNIAYNYELNSEFRDDDKYEKSSIHNLIVYISEHFHEDLTLAKIAIELGYSYNYLSYICNDYYKSSFPDILNSFRIDKAKHLLRNSNASITNIAIESGYNSLRSLNRSFIKYLNITPTEYRKSITN